VLSTFPKSEERIIRDTQSPTGVLEAAMRLRPHRRNLVVWGPPVGPAGRYGVPEFRRIARIRRLRRGLRTGGLLTFIGLIRLASAVRTRWRPLLAGGVLTAVSVTLRSGPGSVAFFPGAWLLLIALLTPSSSKAPSKRRSGLERELAAYSTPAQRCDLEATLDRYPDDITYELRDILASQAMAARNNRIAAAGRY
jgi:hypothetical protein